MNSFSKCTRNESIFLPGTRNSACEIDMQNDMQNGPRAKWPTTPNVKTFFYVGDGDVYELRIGQPGQIDTKRGGHVKGTAIIWLES